MCEDQFGEFVFGILGLKGLNVQQVVKAVLELVASKLRVLGFNPLSPNGDQHQFSPKDIYTLSRD